MSTMIKVRLLQPQSVNGVEYEKDFTLYLPRTDAYRLVRQELAEFAEPERTIYEAPEKRRH